jgi:glycosyltransferase involved in cell wall biosynthesis
MTEKVSLVITVKNEESVLSRLLESIASQTRTPDEVIFVDGGSEDHTVSVIEEYRERVPHLKVVIEPGTNISEGRNRGVRDAMYDVLAVTDAGCRLDPQWLELLLAAFESDVLWCAGDHQPDPKNEFEDIAGKCSTEGYFVAGKKRFKATARNLVFRKHIWEEVGGFPEFLEISEDAYLIHKFIEKGYKFQYVPEAKVFWRPRSSYREIFTQFFRYAYWAARGGIAGKIYGKPLLQQLILALSFVLWILLKKIYLLLIGLGLVGAYILRKFVKGTFGALSLKTFFRVVSIQIVIQLGILTGFLAGVFRRKEGLK